MTSWFRGGSWLVVAGFAGLFFATAATADAATVATLDGQEVHGDSIIFAGDTVTIHGTKLALADCDWLSLGDDAANSAISASDAAPAASDDDAPNGVTLVDGSWLPAQSIGAATAPAAALPASPASATGADAASYLPDTIRVDGPLGALVLPLATVAAWGVFPANAPAGDQDQILLSAGPLSGRVLGITAAGALRFASSIDPKPLEFPVARVAALRMSLNMRVPSGIVLAAATDPAHAPLLVLPRPGLPLAAAPGVATNAGLAGYRLSVEGGRRVYLGSLVPATVSEEGAFGTVWPHTVDHDLDGSPLILRSVRHAHGLVIHSKATLTWNLGGAYLHFHALVGITDAVAPEGDCALTISGDGKALFARDSIKGSDPALPLDLEVKGVKTLAIQVDYGARYDIGDHLAFADAFLLRK